MKQIDDHWMRPRTKAGLVEMRKRLKVLKEALNLASKGPFGDHLHVKFVQQIVKEYFTFDWDNDRRWEEAESSTKSVDTAPEA